MCTCKVKFVTYGLCFSQSLFEFMRQNAKGSQDISFVELSRVCLSSSQRGYAGGKCITASGLQEALSGSVVGILEGILEPTGPPLTCR